MVDELSVAGALTGVTAEPDTEVWSVLADGVTTFTTVHEKVAVSEVTASSVTVTVTEHTHAVVGVPVTAPVAGSIASPAGRPAADQVRVAVDDESVAGTSTVAMAVPEGSDWSPGLVTLTALVTVQVKDAVPEYPAPSVTVTVTEHVHGRGRRAGDRPGGGVHRQPGGQAGGRPGEGGGRTRSRSPRCWRG